VAAAGARVLTLTVIAAPGFASVSGTEAGVVEHVLLWGPPLQARETVPLNAPWPASQTVKLAACPAVIVSVEGNVLLLSAKSVPVPWRRAPTVLPFVSTIERFVHRTPPAVGVNVMLTAQLACDATEVPQLLD